VGLLLLLLGSRGGRYLSEEFAEVGSRAV